MVIPSPNGRIIPAALTLTAVFQFAVNTLKSTSRPTKNKKRIKPRFAAMDKTGIDSAGKMVSM